MAPSHPAPILPLKLWKPTLFSGLALCIGAAAPDLEFVLQIQQNSTISHTVAGQFLFTLPVVLVLHTLLTTIVLPWLVPLFAAGAPWHFEDLTRLRPATRLVDWIRVGVSGVIGGLSHVFLDGFTHASDHTGWASDVFPILALPTPALLRGVPVHEVLQVVLTLVLGALGLQQAARIGRDRLIASWYPERESAPREATPLERRGACGYFLACALMGVAVGFERSHARFEWIELGAYGAVTFTLYGLLLASVIDRLRATRSRRRVNVGTAIES